MGKQAHIITRDGHVIGSKRGRHHFYSTELPQETKKQRMLATTYQQLPPSVPLHAPPPPLMAPPAWQYQNYYSYYYKYPETIRIFLDVSNAQASRWGWQKFGILKTLVIGELTAATTTTTTTTLLAVGSSPEGSNSTWEQEAVKAGWVARCYTRWVY